MKLIDSHDVPGRETEASINWPTPEANAEAPYQAMHWYSPTVLALTIMPKLDERSFNEIL